MNNIHSVEGINDIRANCATIRGTRFDRTYKIYPDQYEEVMSDYNRLGSYAAVARIWNVCPPTIRYVVDTEFRERYNRERRGKPQNYSYNIEKKKEICDYKRKLISNGSIQIDEERYTNKLECTRKNRTTLEGKEKHRESDRKRYQRIKDDPKSFEELKKKIRERNDIKRMGHVGRRYVDECVRDYSGEIRGCFTIIEYAGKRKLSRGSNISLWKVRCNICGAESIKALGDMKRSKNCSECWRLNYGSSEC